LQQAIAEAPQGTEAGHINPEDPLGYLLFTTLDAGFRRQD